MTQYLFRDDKGLYEYQLHTQKKLSLNHLMPSERNQLLSNEETKIITGYSFDPTSNQELILDADGNYTHNTFKRFKTSHNSDQNITNFLELMDRLFPDHKDYEQVMQFIAHMIQRPEQRPAYGLLLTSESGTGKGVLYDKVISPLLAYQSIKVNKYSRLFERFSTVLFNNLLCWLDDPPKSKHDTMQAFRGLTSDPTVTIELKGGSTFTIKTITRLILASNERTPLMLTKDDLRRWYAPRFITHKVDQRETQEFISSIINELARIFHEGINKNG